MVVVSTPRLKLFAMDFLAHSLSVTEIAPPGKYLVAGTAVPNLNGGVKSMRPETMGERVTSSPGMGRDTDDAHVTCSAISYVPSVNVEGTIHFASENPVSTAP